MIARQNSLAGNGNRRRRFQFTLRSLLIFTLVASVVLSIWRSLGLMVMVLVLALIVAVRCFRAVDRLAKADWDKKPLLALARFAAIAIYCVASMCIVSMLWELLAPFLPFDIKSDDLF